MIWIVVILLVSLFLIGFLFVNFSPQFGGKHSDEDIQRYERTGNYKDGKFENLVPTAMDMPPSKMLSTLIDFIKGVPNSRPDYELPVNKVDSLEIVQWKDSTKLIWFGHSAFLLTLEGKTILLDPMFGDVPAPHPWLGNKRYSSKLPIEVAKLPHIDAILISHDHYDHLDYGSIQQLKEKTTAFYVPMGVGAHFMEWGIPKERIVEFAWWDEVNVDDIRLVFTPARHFSGRGLGDRFSTLWGSWVINGQEDTLYFSGDSGYGPHFSEIGNKYGPFDFAMMECGQYNVNWSEIHMMPEETAQAAKDLNTKVMMPIHWGAFTLSLHSWTDPVERVSKAAANLNMPLVIPQIGEQIVMDSTIEVSNNNWWKK